MLKSDEQLLLSREIHSILRHRKMLSVKEKTDH